MQKVVLSFFIIYFVSCQPLYGNFDNIIPKNCCFHNNCRKPSYCDRRSCLCQFPQKNCCLDPSICRNGTICGTNCKCVKPNCCNGMIMCHPKKTCNNRCQCVSKIPCFPQSCIFPLVWDPSLCQCRLGSKPFEAAP